MLHYSKEFSYRLRLLNYSKYSPDSNHVCNKRLFNPISKYRICTVLCEITHKKFDD